MDTASNTPQSLTREQHAQGMAAYQAAGLKLAAEINNRGPVRLDANGKLHKDILDAYWKHGYYIFEGVVSQAEVEELRRDAANMLDRAPVAPGAEVDAKGRPAIEIGRAHV